MSARKKRDVLERVEDSPKDAAYYEREITKCVQDYYFSQYGIEGAEEISKKPQNTWVAAMEYCRRQCINKEDLIELQAHKIHPTCGGIAYNEAYSPEKVEMLAQVYIILCFAYDRTPSIFGFSILSGIDREVLQHWAAEGVSTASRQNTPKRSVQYIRDARTEALQNIATSGGRGVVGAIACLNNTSWRETPLEAPKMHVLTAEELPRLDINGDWQNVERSAEALPDLSNYKI